MNGVSRALLVAAVLLPALSSAQEASRPAKSGFDYNYAELSYDKHDVDISRAPDNIDGDGFTLSGSFKLGDDWHVYGSYATANVDFGINVDTWALGLGYSYALKPNVDLYGRALYIDQSASLGPVQRARQRPRTAVSGPRARERQGRGRRAASNTSTSRAPIRRSRRPCATISRARSRPEWASRSAVTKTASVSTCGIRSSAGCAAARPAPFGGKSLCSRDLAESPASRRRWWCRVRWLARASLRITRPPSTTTKTIVEARGEVVTLLWANPHVRFTLEHEGDRRQRRALGNRERRPHAARPRAEAWRTDVVKVGDVVRIAGNPSRHSRERRMYVTNLLVADGREILLRGNVMPRFAAADRVVSTDPTYSPRGGRRRRGQPLLQSGLRADARGQGAGLGGQPTADRGGAQEAGGVRRGGRRSRARLRIARNAARDVAQRPIRGSLHRAAAPHPRAAERVV